MSSDNDLRAYVQTLEQRVAALEAAPPPPGTDETLQPTYLTLSPAGLVGALFSGGIQMNEETVAGYNAATALGWLDSGGSGQIREYILGLFGGGVHQLQMASYADSSDYAAVLTSSAVTGAAGSAGIVFEARDSTDADIRIDAFNSLGQSSFLQLGSNLLSVAGHSTFTWPGGTAQSGVVTVSLPGAAGNVYGVASSGDIPGFADVYVRVEVIGGGQIQFYGECHTANPGMGLTAPFNYLIWGS